MKKSLYMIAKASSTIKRNNSQAIEILGTLAQCNLVLMDSFWHPEMQQAIFGFGIGKLVGTTEL
jgi:hypothetical protein